MFLTRHFYPTCSIYPLLKCLETWSVRLEKESQLYVYDTATMLQTLKCQFVAFLCSALRFKGVFKATTWTANRSNHLWQQQLHKNKTKTVKSNNDMCITQPVLIKRTEHTNWNLTTRDMVDIQCAVSEAANQLAINLMCWKSFWLPYMLGFFSGCYA